MSFLLQIIPQTYKKSACKFQDEGTSYVAQSPGCFAGRVPALASARCCKEMRVCACVCVCMCVCMYMFVYLYTCVLGGMWVPQVPQDAAEFAMVWLAGEGAGRGLLSYGLLSYGVQSVSGKGI